MKVRCEFTVDIDPEAWEMTYGVPASDPAQMRKDVKEYVECGTRDLLRQNDVLVDEERI